jgi:UDP-2,3-diacylglucosamine pyrophosphatase LpxH
MFHLRKISHFGFNKSARSEKWTRNIRSLFFKENWRMPMLERTVERVAQKPQGIASPKESQLIEYDVILISDIHLGSPMCQAKELAAFLNQIRVKYLILVGDIFDDLKFNRLQHWHWEVLSRLRKISDHCQVIWIRGNHDIVSAKTMSHLLGVHVRNNFSWTSQGKRFYAVHGDRWDTFIYKHRTFTEFVTWIYNAIQRVDSKHTRSFSRWLKKRAKLLTRNCQAIQFSAIEFAKVKGIDAIFCGHTHMATLQKDDGIVYGNDGTWQSDDPHFIGIRNTTISLCKYISDSPIEILSQAV